MVIARIPDTVPDAPTRAITAAHKAETVGYRHVQVTPDLTHGTYTVTADQPHQDGPR